MVVDADAVKRGGLVVLSCLLIRGFGGLGVVALGGGGCLAGVVLVAGLGLVWLTLCGLFLLACLVVSLCWCVGVGFGWCGCFAWYLQLCGSRCSAGFGGCGLFLVVWCDCFGG